MVLSAQKKNLVSSYLKGIDSQLNKRPQVPHSGAHTKMLGTSRNPALVAPAGTKNKMIGAVSSLGASIEDIAGSGALNRTLGGTGGNRYF